MFLRPVRRLTKTIGFRLTIWYSFIFIFSSLILFGIAYFLLSSSIHEKEREAIQTKLNEYMLMGRSRGLESLMDEIRLEDAGNRNAGLFVRIADRKNRTLFLTLPHNWRKIDLDRIEKEVPAREDQWLFLKKKGHKDGALEIASQWLSDDFLLQVGKGSVEREGLLERFREIFAGIMIPTILLGFIGGAFLAFRALRPIRDLIHTVHSVESGRMHVRVLPSQTGDELDELVRLFNGMLERIEALIIGMREALDNVAHDLRTPVTRLRGVVETVLQSEHDPDTLREALMDCAEESERIMTMLNTLMDISEAETGVIQLHLEMVDITSLVKGVLEIYQCVAEDRELALLSAFPDELYARVDPNRIRQVIANLIDNAIKYTPSGGRIKIEVSQHGDDVAVSIKDTGIGIPAHDMPRIFDRLYRGDKSRSQRGLGLGLSLVQAVIHAHKGRIDVESHPGGGTQFTLFLPAVSLACH